MGDLSAESLLKQTCFTQVVKVDSWRGQRHCYIKITHMCRGRLTSSNTGETQSATMANLQILNGFVKGSSPPPHFFLVIVCTIANTMLPVNRWLRACVWLLTRLKKLGHFLWALGKESVLGVTRPGLCKLQLHSVLVASLMLVNSGLLYPCYPRPFFLSITPLFFWSRL